MKAVAKTRPEPGIEIIEVPEPTVGPGQVKIRVLKAAVCGTDLHIYNWDSWSAGRIHPPRIIGHEFCGEIVALGPGVTDRHIGQYVSSESHITCGVCRQCLLGQHHVCINTRILGVDVDGGFAPFAVVPAENARPTNPAIPPRVAAFQDALGNAVHTVTSGPVEGQTILVTGMGPIGLFAVGVCRALGANKVYATEISPFRMDLAKKMGADEVLSPADGDVAERLKHLVPGGMDATLEMSGHPASLDLAVESTRPGGRISLLGVYAQAQPSVDINQIIFKGIEVQGIVGRRLWQTWEEMDRLLTSGKLNLDPVVTHEVPFTEFQTAIDLMKAGQAGKVILSFENA